MPNTTRGPDLLTILRFADLSFHTALPDDEIAATFGVNRRTLTRWRQLDEYRHFIRGFSAYTHRRWSEDRTAITSGVIHAEQAAFHAVWEGLEAA